MSRIYQQTFLELGKNEILTLAAAQGYSLGCQKGELWLTSENATQDIILRPGETYNISSNAKLIIQALASSGLKLWQEEIMNSPVKGTPQSLISLFHWEFPALASLPSSLIR